MSAIFTASADSHSYQHSSRIFVPLIHWLFPSMPQPMVDEIHEFFRKCCHLAEYSIFALLLWRAFSRGIEHSREWSIPKVRRVILVVMLYASTDEFHQIFVPTRTSRVTDVLIDTSGGILGLLALWLLQRCWKPKIQPLSNKPAVS
jgi:VanZ family protein